MINCAGMMMFCWILLTTTRISGQLHEQYIGCFVDNINDRLLDPVLKNQDNLTIEICIGKCYTETNGTQSEMTFAALANGRRCICRNNSGQQLRDRNCNVKCSGNRQQMCGGNATSKFYSMYTVCRVGYFGPNCDQLCHCKRQLPCDRKTGICSDGCEKHWNGANCNIGNVQMQYIGCYGDGPVEENKEAMNVKNPGGKTGVNKQDSNSNEFCIEVCSNNNYTYAGMQYKYDCNCGEVYNRYGYKTHRGIQVNCNERCSGVGKRSQTCGGSFANSVYYVCPVGFYGRDCINRCHCSDGGPCRFNGSCLTSPVSACKPGWTGSACNRRDCAVKNGDCKSDEICEAADLGFANLSVCRRCEDGSYKDNNTCRSIELHYVGCYKGNTTQYESVELPTNDTLTIEFCMLKCRQQNKKYSIIQGGTSCLCGDDYGQISPDDECQAPCVGNKLQYCGGNTVDGTPTYVVYTVNDILWCSTDSDCKLNETCDAIDLKYTNVSRCRCIKGFHRMSKWDLCKDVDECQSNTSSCNPTSENCVNTIGSYICECKDGFVNISGQCKDINECINDLMVCDHERELCMNTIGSYQCLCKPGYEYSTFGNCTASSCSPTTGVLLGTFLAISLLIIALLVVCLVKSAKSRNTESGKSMAQSDFQRSRKNVSGQHVLEQHEENYDVTPELFGENNAYEKIKLEKRQVLLNPTSEYAALKLDDYLNVPSSI